jgi:hypothetical protein
MPNIISTIPINVSISNTSGMVALEWANWFRDLYQAQGSLTIEEIEELIAVITPASLVRVKVSSDFGVIDSTKVYLIDGVIDMTGVTITVPAGGINMTGYTFDVSQLICADDDYTMFISADGGCGNVLAQDIGMTASGINSQLFDLVSATGFDAFEFDRVNFNDCTKVGRLNNFRQGLETGTGRFGGTPIMELIGTWAGGYFIDTSIVRSLADGDYTLYQAGDNFIMSSRFRSNQNIDLPASVSFLDFAPANFVSPSTLQLDGCIVSRNGAFDSEDANITPNISHTDLVSSWTANNGLNNTFVGGKATISTEIDTIISAPNTYEILLGTFTNAGLTHFDSPANGQLRHLGSNPREFTIVADFIMDSTSNNVVDLKLVKWDDSASALVDLFVQRRQVNSLVGARDVAFFNVNVNINLDQNDYIYWSVANETSSADITAEFDSFFVANPR